jgi:filamentous hemagglutinin family protein
MNRAFCQFRRFSFGVLLTLLLSHLEVHANPAGGTVAQGMASINSSGSQLNINQTSPTAFINWQSFNIDAGETVNFNQPSCTSVAWNFINDPNASSINGNLNANGYVVLQNPNGFTVGGSAAITAHGLVMTTASTPALDLSSGGAWSFDAPPPAAKIVNFGKININGGGSAYLIASDILNKGTISAPGGNIGLYAGEKVLVSMSPDARGLSAEVTLPQGSVDNEGHLIADAGSIAAQAKVVNQNGTVQANSVKDVNGTIELVASDSVNLGASSAISANGDSTANAPSSGGSVTIKSDNRFSGEKGSTINISGGLRGGNGGNVEISAPSMAAVNSQIIGKAQPGWSGGTLLMDPDYIVLNESGDDSVNVNGTSGTVLAGDDPGDTLYLDVNSAFIGLSQITLQAKYDITLDYYTSWDLFASTGQSDGQLNLEAGRNIIFRDGSSISDEDNWSVSLEAGVDNFATGDVQPGAGSIYIGDFDGSDPLDNSGFIRTAEGDINLTAGQDVLVGSGGVTTMNGGNIEVTAENGNVNSGTSEYGFDYHLTAPYYTPSSTLGGISTAAGGNVTINAPHGDVISFPTTTVAFNPISSTAGDPDPGTGAFGPEPGDVTINAGGNVYGHFVEVNGTGAINAGQDIGTSDQNVALSLVAGSWNLNAQQDIYLQEVRNPNGVFDNLTAFNPSTHRTGPTAGNHLFDYAPTASVSLTAGNGVDITGYDIPRPDDPVPMLLPPTLIINAGPGGVTLDTPIPVDSSGNQFAFSPTTSDSDITLFPSPDGNLQITTTDGGSLSSGNWMNSTDPAHNTPATSTAAYLLMSDSSLNQWSSVNSGVQPFSENDHGSVPVELNNDNPVVLNISGSMNNLILQVDKLAQITVGGDMNGCSFYGENLHANDVTFINVKGQIYYNTSFTSITLDQPFPDIVQLSQTLPSGETYLPPGTIDNWFTILELAQINPNISGINNQSYNLSTENGVLDKYLEFQSLNLTSFVSYDPNTKKLTVTGPLSTAAESRPTPDTLYQVLASGTLYLPVYGSNGEPLLDSNGHFVINQVTWLPQNTTTYTDPALTDLQTLLSNSQGKPPLGSDGALIVGGMGEFDVEAGSINLGNSDGILSVGNAGTPTSPFLSYVSYSFLTPYMIAAGVSGATVKVTITQADPNPTTSSLEMPSSTIAALGGGDVTVYSENGSMDLGSQDLLPFEGQIMGNTGLGLGIYTSGGGDVNVTASGDINVDSSRIASFNSGNVNVISQTGNVDAGSGGTIAIPVSAFPLFTTLPTPYEYAYANGIVADTLSPLANNSLVPGAATIPGNITVNTPEGSIYASLGGILQESLSGTLPEGPSITLNAGNDINLGQSGVIGGTVNVTAGGQVTGLLISEHNANVTSQTIGNLTVLAAGTANVSGSGSAGITIIGGQGVNTSGIGSGATLLGQNVNSGSGAHSTLGNSADATSTSQSAAQQSTQSAAQQVANNDNGDDDKKKKKKKPEIRKVGRVTVILSAAVPGGK